MNIYCRNCEHGCSPQAQFCPKCGHPLATPEARPVPQQPAAAPPPQIIVQQAPQPKWHPGVAAVLSVVIPGLGQLYKGQPISGLVWLVLVSVGYFLLIIPGLVLHLCCVIGASMGDTYKTKGI